MASWHSAESVLACHAAVCHNIAAPAIIINWCGRHNRSAWGVLRSPGTPVVPVAEYPSKWRKSGLKWNVKH